MKRVLHISKEEIDKKSRQIFRPIKNAESAVGICYAGCKIDYLLSCLLENRSILRTHLGLFYKRLLFILIHLDYEDTQETFLKKIRDQLKQHSIQVKTTDTFVQMLEKILFSGKEPYFFLLDAHLVPLDNLAKILHTVHDQIVSTNRFNAMVFFEANIYREDISQILQKNNKFLQNTLVFPVYSKEESKKFLINLAQIWSLKITKEIVNEITASYGGSLWLLREALRCIRDTSTNDHREVINSPGIKLRIMTIYHLFTAKERVALSEICFGDAKQVQSEYKDYFLLTGIIKQNRHGYDLTLPLLENLLKQNLVSKSITLSDNGSIIYNNKDIGQLMTTSEYNALSVLLHRQGQLVTREVLAQSIWKDEWVEQYSDWALDKLISRLRKTLQHLGLNEAIVHTKKGKGYVLL